MNVCSIEWLVGLLLVSALFPLLSTVRQRQALVALCNFGFLMTLVPGGTAWAALALVLAAGYLAVKLVQRFPRALIIGGYLAVLVLGFILLKQYAFAKPFLPAWVFRHPVAIVGLSYMLFRQIHLVVDLYQGQLAEVSLWDYLNYQLNLFGLVAGPIQRYPDFCQYWQKLAPVLTDAESLLKAYLRVFLGVLKVAWLGGLCLGKFESSVQFLVDPTHIGDSRFKTLLHFLAAFYSYPAYVYFNFSGYCDMVIAGAALVGIRMPENFQSPFLSRNMIEYWTRWHRTLGFWIRDYVFTPMYKAIATRWPRKAASLAFLCYFAALFLTGVWHGSTWNFVVFGLLNGLGVAAAKLWENYLTGRFGRAGFQAYLRSRMTRVAAVVLNFNYVCLTILFFSPDLGKTIQVLRRTLSLI